MQVTSPGYIALVCVTVIAYYVLPSKWQWFVLLGGSSFFYAKSGALACALLLTETLMTYVLAWAIIRSTAQSKRKQLLSIGIAIPLLGLAVFKYNNFLLSTLSQISVLLGFGHPAWHVDIIQPIGISFYSLVLIGFLIDVYAGKIKPEAHIGRFAAFAWFFPSMSAGPIERGREHRLLPQLATAKSFCPEQFCYGLQMIAWGFCKKIVVANQLEAMADLRFVQTGNAAALVFAGYLYAFQLYFDFSAYSDIAIGTARLFGIDLLQNFVRPYAAVSVGDFWRRWHISLSSWFRDYVYIPLGGSRVSLARNIVNILIVFLISGLWHGPNWTFVVWGTLNGICIALENITQHVRRNIAIQTGLARYPSILHSLAVLRTFHIVVLLWLVFRSASLQAAFGAYQTIFFGVAHGLNSLLHGQMPAFAYALQGAHLNVFNVAIIAILIALTECVEYVRHTPVLRDAFLRQSILLRWPLYYALILAVLIFGRYENHAFIYVRF